MNHFPNDQWDDLGLQLGIVRVKLNEIRANNPRNVKNCLKDCLTLWLQRDYNTEEYDKPTMESLAGALRKMGLKATASRIMGEQADRASSVVTLDANTSSRERRICLIV